jgi:hypothetical protein
MRRRSFLTLIALSLLAACTETAGPSPAARVAGSYVAAPAGSASALGAARFITTQDGRTIDRLVQGAEIALTLHPDGTTSGRLRLPLLDGDGEPGDGAAMDEDLAGTWQLDGDVLRLRHDADTFLRDLPLTVHADRLEGSRTFDGVTVHVALARR